jgi:hypothetical protein
MEDGGSGVEVTKPLECQLCYKTNSNKWPIIYGHEYTWIRK